MIDGLLVVSLEQAIAAPFLTQQRAAGTLMRANPKLIVCDISGYGNSGLYRDRKAYDLLIQAESGFLSVTGTPDEPAKAGSSIADIAAAMYGYSSVLAALLQRGKTGANGHHFVHWSSAILRWRKTHFLSATHCATKTVQR